MLLLRRTIGVSCLVAFLTVGFALPRVANAAPPLLVQGTEAHLVAAGCERVKLADDKAMRAAEALDWQAVVASDATGEALIFCPESVLAESQLVGGRVAGLMNEAEASVFLSVGGQVGGAVGSTLGQWIAGKEVTAGTTLKAAFPEIALVLSLISKATAGLVIELFSLFAGVGLYLLEMALEAIPPLLSLSVFVKNKMVQDTWPVVLAVANAGFLLALVFIALLTTLRLDVGGGVRKLLPRLLIAALLVNFSLVIAGAILDISRVIMGLMVVALKAPGLNLLPDMLSRQANGWRMVIDIDKALGEGNWSMAVAKIIQALFVWFMLVASLVVVFGLFVRYIMLIALLIVSPFAYLFIALPGASGLAKKWWSVFMRYIIYGPVVLFFLIAAAGNTGIMASVWGDFFADNARREFYVSFLNTATFSSMMILAALAGRYAGIVGSATAIALATGAGRRVRGMAYRGVAGTGKAAARGVYVGTGARAGMRSLGRQTRDFGRSVKEGLVARLPAAFRPVKRDAQGRPLAGQPTTVGQRLGRWATGGLPPVQRREAQAARAVGAMGGGYAGNLGNSAISGANLSKGHVTEAIGNAGVQEIAVNSQSNAQVAGLVRNVDLMRQLGDQGQLDLLVNIEANPNLAPAAKANLVNQVHNTIEKARGIV